MSSTVFRVFALVGLAFGAAFAAYVGWSEPSDGVLAFIPFLTVFGGLWRFAGYRSELDYIRYPDESVNTLVETRRRATGLDRVGFGAEPALEISPDRVLNVSEPSDDAKAPQRSDGG